MAKSSPGIIICADGKNDIAAMLEANNYPYKTYADPLAAVQAAKKGSGILFLAGGYPAKKLSLPEQVWEIAARKKLRLYIEYPAVAKQLPVADSVLQTQLERGIITTSKMKGADSLDLIGIHNSSVIKAKSSQALLMVGKVAGFDVAQYGIADVKTYPLLFQHKYSLVATTKLSNSITGRFGPVDHLRPVWEHIFSWLDPSVQWQFKNWPLQVAPMFKTNEQLPANSTQQAMKKGVDWFYNGRFFVHPTWEALFLQRQGDGLDVAGPPLDLSLPVGDGSLGVLEGHLSRIQADGSQIYRYWMRADCNAEVAFALTTVKDPARQNNQVAANLLDYIFKHSNLRAGSRNDKSSVAYGLVGWSTTHPHVYYGDDNARVILGAMGAAAGLQDNRWNRYIAEAILANFRTTGKTGFRGPRLEDDKIVKQGLKALQEGQIINPHPHFEAWMWACYLWLYDKTGYKPLLDQAKKAIAITMEIYPDWKWTNGIQQERARMILPLAWLVRVEDTPQHRQWLATVADRLLQNLDASGAIREELGAAGAGQYGATKSNADYGKHEAPLIAKNGDEVADMLYTTNFAFFALNEAAAATNDKKYRDAVAKIADFLVRIQVQSKTHPDLDGAWFRAFDYKRWEYWASNADAGWGAWGTLTGWTQSWIVSTLAMKDQQKSLWEITKNSDIKQEALPAIQLMLKDPLPLKSSTNTPKS
ncbi:hypothetical protein AAE02nite_01760 [Adhaeribacter aerolatus]|uniref:Uncharacterized protein n=2 Tax=Adhaeribacter aerolatus TaxID=670289 RepID=A0A512AS31_9BACT|nr:hypothetical protein AAE02nite_01760 [Adhaeribacter aerolatus]